MLCSGIIEFVVPDSVETIGNSAFANCASLESISIGKYVTAIEYSTFAYCTALKNFKFTDSILSIVNNAFGGCTAIKNLIIGHSVITIGDQAFYGRSALSSVIIPASIENIVNKSAFLNCNSLVRVTVDFDNTDINIDYWINRFNTIYMTLSSPSTVIEKFCKNNIYTINVDYPDKVNATLIGDSNISIKQGTTFVDPGVDTSNVKYKPATVKTEGTVETSKIGTYMLIYIVIDAYNNIVMIKRVVNVVASQ